MTYVDMSSNHLIGNIFEALSKLMGLRYLNLSNNMIDGAISPNLGRKLRALESLDLLSNNLAFHNSILFGRHFDFVHPPFI